ncbi:MAG: hypothetical protein IJX78_05325 [Bacilli bacterium]|nr:hypothetical protein [Bacilli bacterium]
MKKNQKILLIVMLCLLSLCLISCGNSNPFEDRENRDYYQDKEAIKMYQKAGYFDKLGFYYGDYVIKSQVYAAAHMSFIPHAPSNNDLAEGKVFHFYDSQYEFSLYNEFLEHKKEMFNFSLVNYVDFSKIVNCIGVKKKFLESECIYDFLLLVDEDSRLYYIDRVIDENFEFSMFSVSTIYLMEEFIPLLESKLVLNDENISMPYDEFVEAAKTIEEVTYKSWSDLVETKFWQAISGRACIRASGVLHECYKIGNKYILSIYSDNIYDNIVLSLTYYDNGIAMYTLKNPSKFAEFIKGEKYHNYLGIYYLNDNDFVEIGISAEGPYLYCEISDNSYGNIKKYGGPFEIKEDYIIAKVGNDKYLYFQIIEENNRTFLIFDENKSDVK